MWKRNIRAINAINILPCAPCCQIKNRKMKDIFWFQLLNLLLLESNKNIICWYITGHVWQQHDFKNSLLLWKKHGSEKSKSDSVFNLTFEKKINGKNCWGELQQFATANTGQKERYSSGIRKSIRGKYFRCHSSKGSKFMGNEVHFPTGKYDLLKHSHSGWVWKLCFFDEN